MLILTRYTYQDIFENRAIPPGPENVRYPVGVYVMYGFTIVIVYATVCTGVRFMRCSAEFERRRQASQRPREMSLT
jgi:hypothetical protein